MKFFTPFTPPVAPVFPDKTFNIKDYGATEGGNEKVTEAIKSAIEDCANNGGGKVVIPAGKWLTGPIHLKSNINLHIEEGAVVEFSQAFEDYLPTVFGVLAGIRVFSPSHFIYAYKCQNIAITGNGTLNGHGEAWWYMKKAQPGMEDLMVKAKNLRPVTERVYDKASDGVRPRLIQLVECENVLIDGLNIFNSPSFNVHPVWCKNIIIRNLSISAEKNSHNTDGIDLEACKRGLVENCTVSTEDDILCLKSGRAPDAWQVGIPCEDIEIRNCRSAGGHGAITIGSEVSAGIRNIWMHDLEFQSPEMGIRIKTMNGRGGYVENIDFENIKFIGARRSGISISMRYKDEPLDDHSAPKENMTRIQNISISNVSCTECKKCLDLVGEIGYEMKNIHLSNVNISGKEPMTVENVQNLTMENVSINITEE